MTKKQCLIIDLDYSMTNMMKGLLSLVSGSNKCGQCAHNYKALIIPFILAGIALAAFNIALNFNCVCGYNQLYSMLML